MSSFLYSLSDLGFSNYSITTDGAVFSHHTNEFLANHLDKRGYPRQGLFSDTGQYVTRTIHRLVAMKFIPNPDHLPQVDHVNGIKTDNRVCNLRWVTNLENSRAAMHNGLMPHAVFVQDDVVRDICQRLQDGESVAHIALDTGFSYDAITAIRLRRNWVHISKDYIFPEPIKQNYPSKETIHRMCQMLQAGVKPDDVMRELGLRRETVYRTLAGKIHRDVAAQYHF